ncbi:transcriptional regulator EpsA [Rhodocyclus tenuis]|uniref:Transcriptional regulator EpsA n=2 Tax=Rhodocyclus TaxID=1064 RepID=A0A6L5JUG8_RHOTE|nr:XrtB/PEP-CTERM-associated transcriptional regulator EpsA [Rhodocyclus gracilis]MQY51023.1 transcriptional regulator EpsA [Rhodocyclus gracilis]NJA88733.1 transcriptional regulator EpsA [Rhodocyclus gracilis]
MTRTATIIAPTGRPAPGTESFLDRLSMSEIRRFFATLEAVSHIRLPIELLAWLRGDVQSFLSHEALIIVWGDFSRGLIHYEILSANGTHVARPDERAVLPLLQGLFERWIGNRRKPFHMTITSSLFGWQSLRSLHRACAGDSEADSALVHGIKDERRRHDCLYVLLGGRSLQSPQALEAISLLLPYLDTAQRQVTHLASAQLQGEKPQADASNDGGPATLSPRELEIMEWVSKGKTNPEIGMILDISMFTVKNHLKRIFKKLDVLNRAQAVAKYKALILAI